MTFHGPDINIAALRSSVSELVEREGELLAQAFELSRAGGDPKGVEALFARVQAIQLERNTFRKRIGDLLGTHRLHTASEVCRAGFYDYRREVGGPSERVRIAPGPLGLQVHFAGAAEPVRLEPLPGTFDGPLAVDDAASHAQASPPEPKRARKPPPRRQ